MAISRFIAEYYVSTMGEALGLLHPFSSETFTPVCVSIDTEMPQLTFAQRCAYDALQKNDRVLLFGATGSGKTEILIHLMADTLRSEKAVIMLMPEIALTPQMEKRLKRYFGDMVAIWHSRLRKKKKEEILTGIHEGRIRIVAGARSALFVPLKDIGLIVVDEEHDDSYKAHNRPRYHARDTALFMGKILGAKVVLGSATPSLASYARQPVVRIEKPFVETRKRYIFESGGCTLTDNMIHAIERHTAQKGQVLIFLPTRANFKYLYCETCGYKVTCPYCSVGMSLHRRKGLVRCHYCGYAERIPDHCPQCGSTIRSERMGTAETVELLRERFADLVIEQFDKDTITTANKLQKTLDRFAKKEIDILVGTQMLSKGHDYPDITLAIVMGLDYILALPDYRARERAMSLFVQIAGRAGRAREAEVIVQTNDAEFFRRHIDDYEGFMKEEIAMRKGLYPPSKHLCRLLFSGKKEDKVAQETEKVRKMIESIGLVEIVGAGRAPIEKIAGKFRYHILLRSDSRTDMLKTVTAVNDGSFEVDMDPVEFG